MKLFPWQREAVKKCNLYPHQNYLITAPTSAGKTLVGYVLAGIYNPDVREFTKPQKRVFWTVPVKSLANDKFFELKEVLGENVGILTGDVKINPDAPIIICTQEVYQKSFKGQNNFVVIDEFHYTFQAPDRALNYVNLSEKDQYLFLSATVKTTPQLISYLERISGRKVFHYSTDFRPVELVYDSEPLSFSEILNIHEEEVVLNIAFSVRNIQDAAFLLTDELPDLPSEKIEQALRIAQELGLKNPPMWEVEKGVFIYHGKLSFTEKRFIEVLFKKGLARAVVSTDAVSVGVNFPVDRVIFWQLEKFDGRQVRPLYPSEFRQIAGRAGRFGMKTKGRVSCVCDSLSYDWVSTKEIYKELLESDLEPPSVSITLKLSRALSLQSSEVHEEIKRCVDYTFPSVTLNEEELEQIVSFVKQIKENFENSIPTDVQKVFKKLTKIEELDIPLVSFDASEGSFFSDVNANRLYELAVLLTEKGKNVKSLELVDAVSRATGFPPDSSKSVLLALRIARKLKLSQITQDSLLCLLEEIDPVIYRMSPLSEKRKKAALRQLKEEKEKEKEKEKELSLPFTSPDDDEYTPEPE